MSIFSLLNEPPREHPQMDEVLRKLLDRFFFLYLILGTIVEAVSFMRGFMFGWHFTLVIHVCCYFVVLFILLFRKQLPLRLNMLFLFSTLFVIAMTSLYGFSLLGSGVVMLFFTLTLIVLFFGIRESLLAMTIATISLLVIAAAICSGLIPMNFDMFSYGTSILPWLSQIVVFVFLSVLVILCITVIKTRLLCSLHDLEKRSAQLAEANGQLTESEKKIRTILETVPESITTSDLAGTITSCNKATLDLLGYSDVGELIGKSVFQFVIAEDRQRAADTLSKTMQEHIIRNTEYTLEDKNGKKKSINFTVTVLRKNTGEPYGFLGVTQDVTRAKEMEGRLRQSEKMEAIGQLAGGIAHDFNNQLAGVAGYADLLREEVSENPKLSKYANNIIISTKRAADLTTQLLAFARKGKYLSVVIDLHKIIAEVIGILQRAIDKRIVIRQRLEARSPKIQGDPTQVQNAILNIVLNARDAMPNGGELVISTSETRLDDDYCKMNPYEIKPGNYILVSITDTGIGMDAATQKRIFEPFFTTKEQGKGTGMGLASVYGTVKNHGGSISVYSEPGRGTTMNLYLPQTQAGPEPKDDFIRQFRPSKGDAHILLVDDDDFIIEIASKMLTVCGYSVSSFKNGFEAVQFFKENWERIDLVILDMVMPQMNGKETFVEMKKINPDVHALLSSGYSLDSEVEQMLSEGIMGFIHKPYQRIELLQKVVDALKKNNHGK